MCLVKGLKIGSNRETCETDVNLTASRLAGVWLVDGSGKDDNSPFRVTVGCPMEQDAARAYAMHRKSSGHVPPVVFRVFPLVSLEPISLTEVVDQDGDETWSAFQDAWVEIRL